jgi:hypothetical protein
MSRQLLKSSTLVFMTLLLIAAQGAWADNRVFPTVATNWPRLHGAAGTKQLAVFGSKVNSNSYSFLGQSVISTQRSGAFFSLVPSSGATTPTTFTDGSALNFDMNAGRLLSTGNFVLVGVKTISATETRGSIFVRSSTGTAVANLQTLGSTGTGTRFNDVIELTGSQFSGKLAMVGFTTQSGNAGAGDMYYALTTVSGGTITADHTAMVGSTNEDEAFTICQVTDSTVVIGGRTKSGSNNDIYVKLVKITDASAVAGFALSGAAGAGNDDAIRDILVDGDGNLMLVGASGTTTARRGYLAKISATTGTLVAGYEFTTADTDVELYSAELMANGNIVVTGRKGTDLYLSEIQDNGHAFVMDWAHAYDSGRTGDVGRYVKVQADSTILVAGLANDASSSTDAVFWLFSAPQLQSNPNPTAFNLTSPTDSSTLANATPTLTWEASTDTLLGYTIHYELTYANNSGFTSAAVVSDIATNSYTFSSNLPLATTYYWKVVAQDGTGYERACAQSPDGWRFITPPNPLYVSLNSDVASTTPYYDNGNIAGFSISAGDTFDTYDIPEPPLLGDNYIQTYFYESGFTGFRQKLSADFRSLNDKSLDSNAYVYKIRTMTDQSDSVTYTFDVTTNNSNSYPVIFWNGTDFQGLLGASDADNVYKYLAAGSPGSPETKTFGVLIGDKVAPVVAPVLPAADSTTEITRSGTTTLAVGIDNTCPVRRTTIAFSPMPDSTGAAPNEPRENFTTLGNMPVTPETPDNPNDGIVNANLTFDWVPYTDDWGLFSAHPIAILNSAQLRYITEDWAGNIDTMYACFKLVPDAFHFTGDYPAGWHLLSIPLTPDANAPSDVFLTHTGNDSGIAGGFSVFGYSLAGGYVQPSSMTIGKGYFMVLHEDNTTAAGNAGLGVVKGTIPRAVTNVDVALDAGAPNLIGVSVRNEELGGNHLQADDWLFSVDNFSTAYTWTEATTTADKGGDASIWLDPSSFVAFDNSSGDYTTMIDGADDLDPGEGYLFVTGSTYSGTLKMRTRRDSAAVDGFRPILTPAVRGGTRRGLDEFTGDWILPITMTLGTMHNTLSGLGCRNGATAGWDNGIDITAPPLPPSGNYVRAVVDGHSWGSPFGQFFVQDIRAPYTEERMSDAWDFNVNASEDGPVSMRFDLDALTQYSVPDGFHATATVNGQTFDLNQNHTLTFDYTTGAAVVVHVVATFSALAAQRPDPTLPTEYEIVSAYPNPFNPAATIRIALPAAAELTVIAYNTLGEQVMTLAAGRYAAGYHNIAFDARSLSSGVYFISAKVPGKLNQLQRVVLLR